MNASFAVSLFDSPWVVVVFVIVSALVNWLSNRGQGKQPKPQPEADQPSPASSKPPGEFNLEETLRQLMGEEPPPRPLPPPLAPRGVQGEATSAETTLEDVILEPAKHSIPPLPPEYSAAAQVSIPAATASEEQERAARRFGELREQGRHPATVVGHGREYRRQIRRQAPSPWREPRSARQAFVASLVFAPPKSLEP